MKNVVIGVAGGIAAYKSLDVVSRLKKKDINVDVIMTESATQFVTALSFQSLSQNPVITNMFDEPKAFEIAHISLAKKADLLLVCPATANIIGKVANGIADDMLSTTIMATKAKVVFALAMNTNMYNNPIFQENVSKLRKLGYHFIDPDSGRLACGDTGKGKLADPEIIVEEVTNLLGKSSVDNLSTSDRDDTSLGIFNNDFKGKRVLITAGPTVVPVDPVRILTNRSSGKMGYSIAKAAQNRGADVTLISGPVSLPKIEGIRTQYIETNEDMYNAVVKNLEDTDILIMTAAVADYKIKNYSSDKIKKDDGDLILSFERDRDILKSLNKTRPDQLFIGFAAESNDHDKNAMKKLREKNIDMIVMNDISHSAVFGKDDTDITVFTKEKKNKFSGSKDQASDFILNEIKDTLIK